MDMLIGWLERPVVAKFSVTVAIVVGVFILRKLSDAVLARWNRSFREKLEKKDPAVISSVDTRVEMARRVTTAALYLFALILIFLQFDALRSIGAGLLASAGVAGIIIGLAAQGTVSNFIAGISISFVQPVRLNDAVIFAGEFGWIEEISLMHTIIRTWDNRRIVVPNSVMVSSVIQNWSIKDTALIGKVMLYVDYTCEVGKVRKWVEEIVAGSSYSTAERVAVVQVVDFTEKTMVLRVLGKGPDAPATWNLRCEIREQLIERFRKEGLPMPRLRLSGPVAGPGGDAEMTLGAGGHAG